MKNSMDLTRAYCLAFIIYKSFYHPVSSKRDRWKHVQNWMVNRRANISHPNPRRQRIRAGIVPALCLITVLQFPLEVSPTSPRSLRAILKASTGANSILGRVVYPRPPAAPSRWPLYFKQSGRRELYGI